MNTIRALITIDLIYFGISNYTLRNKLSKLDNELGISKSNIEYYQNALTNSKEENRVLQLDINDFKSSNDSLINELNKTKDQLKIKDSELKSVSRISTILTDTITDTITVDRDFYVELKSNELTTIKINRKEGQITCIPEIYNHQDLFIIEEKVYRNKYKNWFQRLIHFDFKKDKVENYKIINSNNCIRVLDTRVIKLSQ